MAADDPSGRSKKTVSIRRFDMHEREEELSSTARTWVGMVATGASIIFCIEYLLPLSSLPFPVTLVFAGALGFSTNALVMFLALKIRKLYGLANRRD